MTPFQSLIAKFVVGLFGLGLIALGLAAARLTLIGIGTTLRVWRLQRRRRRWPSTQGQIVRSRVGSDTGDVLNHPPVVEYHYDVNGVRHQGSQSDFDADTRREAEEIVARYEKGMSVPVFYDPDDSRQSVLERNTAGGCFTGCLPVLLSILAIALIAGGIGILTPHGVFRK